jgi:hypothetical protein
MAIEDALKFELFNLEHMFKALKDDPKRIFLGVDQPSTKLWNTILGRDDKAIVGPLGSASNDAFRAAEAKGINTGTARGLHDAAQVVAGLWGGYGAANGLINAAAAAGSTGAIAAPTAGGAAVGAPTTAGATGGATGGAAKTGAAGATSGGFNWGQILGQAGNTMSSMGQNQAQQEEAALDALARRGPPPSMGGSNLAPVPIDQYQQALTPVRRALG